METLYEIIKEYWVCIVTVLIIDFIMLFLAATIGSMLKELDDEK